MAMANTQPPPAASWASLPLELIELVVGRLSIYDTLVLSGTSRSHRKLLLPVVAREAVSKYPHFLFWACSLGCVGLVDLLLSSGADPNTCFEIDEEEILAVPPHPSRTPDCSPRDLLDRVYRHGKWDTFEDPSRSGNLPRYVTTEPRDPWDRGLTELECPMRWWFPLHAAAHYGQTDVVRLLVERGASLNTSSANLCFCVSASSLGSSYPRSAGYERWYISGRWTPLHHALCAGHQETALVLLELGATMDSPWLSARSAMESAVIYGCTRVVHYLHHKHAGELAPIPDGCSSVARFVLEHHAGEVASLTRPREMLSLTALGYHILGVEAPDLTSLLLEQGCSGDDGTTFAGTQPALELACMTGRFDIAIELARRSRLINASGSYRENTTPPHNGADVHPLPTLKRSPMVVAAASLCLQTLAILVDAGASVNQEDSEGRFPLASAVAEWPSEWILPQFKQDFAEREPLPTIKLLLEHGAIADQRSSVTRRTALWEACRNGSLSVAVTIPCIDELIQHGATVDTSVATSIARGADIETALPDVVGVWRALVSTTCAQDAPRGDKEAFAAAYAQAQAAVIFLLDVGREKLLSSPDLFWEATKHPDWPFAIGLLGAGPPDIHWSPPLAEREEQLVEGTCLHNLIKGKSYFHAPKRHAEALLEQLIQLGIDINKGNPLGLALGHGRSNLALRLLEAGAASRPGVDRNVLIEALKENIHGTREDLYHRTVWDEVEANRQT
ncbi:ankyrin repeat-containing domain protein [Microdochium trichocladiopsis]|uniref:Ankyrin repeat-containing domain protein n=1 Tax=Microdochium trichocladiopsis TaxID=1682393 RepID=A0A9P8Y104_9PEZI|nr:ankyrin repeat-containing domain protein [Microdochium trichocladiopsis]KAH7024861.1 ankyrin repeat-containing domain protein [Microdochium trichocladiopsis]